MNSSDYVNYVEKDAQRWNFWESDLRNFQKATDHIRGQLLLRLLPGRGGRMVLDAGAGDGHLSWLMLAEGHKVLSLDLSFHRLDKARSGSSRALTAVQANCGNIPLADASFDAVVFSEILEHLEDPATAIREGARVLRPGGRMIISVPHAQDAPDVVCPNCLKTFNAAGHVNHFDVATLTGMTVQAGMRVERVFGGVSSLSRYCLRRLPRLAPFITVIDRGMRMLSKGDNLHLFLVAGKEG